MAKYEIYKNTVVFADKQGGAFFYVEDENWYPFRYFENGDIDIYDKDGGYSKPSKAYEMSKLIFT